MGITWQVVVAAEMISGGGQGGSTGAGGGLGFLIWNSYLGGAIPHVIVGMIGLGVAGYAVEHPRADAEHQADALEEGDVSAGTRTKSVLGMEFEGRAGRADVGVARVVAAALLVAPA